MEVTFHRLPGRRYFSTAVRDDGVTVFVPGYDRTSPIPHDLAHFIAEREFGLSRGFWGSVAAGAMFTNMTVVSGRRRPHATERSKRILKDHADGIGESEAVAAVIHDAVAKGQRADVALAALARLWAVASPEPLPVTAADIERVIDALREAAGRWADVPENEGLTLRWPLPVVRTQVGRRASRRPARGRGAARRPAAPMRRR